MRLVLIFTKISRFYKPAGFLLSGHSPPGAPGQFLYPSKMKTFNRFSLALLASSLLLLTGCATNTSELTLDTSSVSSAANPQS